VCVCVCVCDFIDKSVCILVEKSKRIYICGYDFMCNLRA
jgi:hypothetical protein